MKQKTTVTELSRQLGGLSRATIYRLKRLYPNEAPPLDEVEKWRSFALLHLIGVDAITRVGR
jgi:hypothetical protein